MDTSVCAGREGTTAAEKNSYYCGCTQDCAMSYGRSVSIAFVLDQKCKLTLPVDALAKPSGYVRSNLDCDASRMTRLTLDSAKMSHGQARLYGTMCDKTLSTARIRSRFIRTMTSSDAYRYLRRWARGVLVLRLMFTLAKETCWSVTLRVMCARRRVCAACTWILCVACLGDRTL